MKNDQAIFVTHGVIIGIYFLDKGENIPKHRHSITHDASVAKGSAEVEVQGQPKFKMTRRGQIFELPANIDHEIRALEDGTIIVNVIRDS